MASKDDRQKSRRQSERRCEERRVVTYEFGSDEWIEMIQQNYLLWPKQDRRVQDRRKLPRRKASRRLYAGDRPESRKYPKSLSDLLTSEEKQMLNDLIQSDSTD
jgi:hypothetical protein